MIYLKQENCIEIKDKEDFDIVQILECGQVFSYKKIDDYYLVLSGDKFAKIYTLNDCILIKTKDVDYFENYFDLKTDYSSIKQTLNSFPIMQEPIKFGKGIRILKQDLFETLISFIISANNNIPRIKNTLFKLRQKFGKKISELDNEYTFPKREDILLATVEDFKEIGCGYRAEYLHFVIRQIQDELYLNNLRFLDTQSLRLKLLEFKGVGPKVADCILLFAYSKMDVFPVDTWIAKMYKKYYKDIDNRTLIRENLISIFNNLSGYAQQYLFYFMRSFEE